jgi:hypothetical protein
MRAIMIVRAEPRVKIGLERLQRCVDLLAEGNLVELIEDGLMETFADPVSLW